MKETGKPKLEIKFCVITEIGGFDPTKDWSSDDPPAYGMIDDHIQKVNGQLYVGCYDHNIPGDPLPYCAKVPAYRLGQMILVETSGDTNPMELFSRGKPGKVGVGYEVFDDLPSAVRRCWEIQGMEDAEDFYDMSDFLERHGVDSVEQERNGRRGIDCCWFCYGKENLVMCSNEVIEPPGLAVCQKCIDHYNELALQKQKERENAENG